MLVYYYCIVGLGNKCTCFDRSAAVAIATRKHRCDGNQGIVRLLFKLVVPGGMGNELDLVAIVVDIGDKLFEL